MTKLLANECSEYKYRMYNRSIIFAHGAHTIYNTKGLRDAVLTRSKTVIFTGAFCALLVRVLSNSGPTECLVGSAEVVRSVLIFLIC